MEIIIFCLRFQSLLASSQRTFLIVYIHVTKNNRVIDDMAANIYTRKTARGPEAARRGQVEDIHVATGARALASSCACMARVCRGISAGKARDQCGFGAGLNLFRATRRNSSHRI